MSEKVPFCDNPHCRFHAVKIKPDCMVIERELPVAAPEAEPMIERHQRFPYQVTEDKLHHFCDICATAIEMCRPPKQEIIMPERKIVLAS